MKRDTLTLECTHTAFHGLHTALDKVKATSATVKVDKASLGALLRDHSRIITSLRGFGLETKEGA